MSTAARRGLALILTVGALLRFVPIWFGLPYPLARPDEEVAIGRAVEALNGDLNPHFFHWPSLTFYVFAGALGAASGMRELLGLDDPMTFAHRALVTRALVALCGTLTILVLFRLAQRVSGDRQALLAAAFLAVAVLHVRESHFAMTDALMTLLLWTSLALLLRAEGSWRMYALAGLAGGLATSTKYNAAAVAVAMTAAQVLLWVRRPSSAISWRGWLPIVVFAGAMAAGFLVATPYALLDYPKFSEDLRYDFTHLSGGHNDIILGPGWIYHATHSLPYGVGLGAFAAAIIGVVPFARRHRDAALILAGFAVSFYVALGSGYTVFFRYVLPLVPFLCLLAAAGVDSVSGWVARRFGAAPPAVLAVAVAVTLGPALLYAVWFDALLARTDTRVLAGEWLTAQLAPGDTVHDAGGIYTRLDLWRVPVTRVPYDAEAGTFAGRELPQWLVLHTSPLRAYTPTPPALARLARERYVLTYEVRGRRPGAPPGLYDRQDAFFLPVTGFAGILRPGPDIAVYRRGQVRE